MRKRNDDVAYALFVAAIAFLLAIVAVVDAGAQIVTPNADDYAVAARSIAIERAAEDILALEETARAIERVRIASGRALSALEEERLRELLWLDRHAANVQRWAGEPRRSIVPGTGWHRVHR